jgi:hypothetical protein
MKDSVRFPRKGKSLPAATGCAMVAPAWRDKLERGGFGLVPFALVFAGVVGGAAATVSILALIGTGARIQIGPISGTDYATLIAGFGGAAFGAAVGGFISWLLASQASREQLARDDRQRIESEKAAVLSVILKVLDATNALYTLYSHIARQLQKANERGALDLPMYTKILPSIGVSGAANLHFMSEDFIPFVTAKRSDIVNRCQLTVKRTAALEISFERYCDLRNKMGEFVRPFSKLKNPLTGEAETIISSREKAAEIELMQNEVDMLIRDIWRNVQIDLAEAQALCAEIDLVSRELFKGKGPFVGLVNGIPGVDLD